MKSKKSNEIIEIPEVTKTQGGLDVDTLQIAGNILSMASGMAQQVAENQAAKYRAQAEVLIAEIENRSKEEILETYSYYTIRAMQEAEFSKELDNHREKSNLLREQLLNTEDERKEDKIRDEARRLHQETMQRMDKIQENTSALSQDRQNMAKIRRGGLFGFLKKR